ncbi:MAG: hypothetical protein WHS82_00555 [Candidatus Methanosuratincola sp.]
MNARSVSIIGLMAAVYAVVTLLPGFPVIGAPGSEIDLARSLEPIYGIIMGPYFGPLSAFLGAVLGKIVSGESAGLLFTPLALVSTLSAALIYKDRVARIPGWAISGAILTAMVIAWSFTQQAQNAPYFAVPHIAATAIAFGLGGRLSRFLRGSKIELLAGLFLVSYISTMTGNMLGNLIFVAVYSPSPYFFVPMLAITLPERLLISLASTIIGAPLTIAARKLSKPRP